MFAKELIYMNNKSKKPEVFFSECFIAEPVFHLSETATDEQKEEFETYMNTGERLLELMDNYAQMRDPYYTWEGEVIDKGEFGDMSDIGDISSFLW